MATGIDARVGGRDPASRRGAHFDPLDGVPLDGRLIGDGLGSGPS